jgi:hypothetical protein
MVRRAPQMVGLVQQMVRLVQEMDKRTPEMGKAGVTMHGLQHTNLSWWRPYGLLHARNARAAIVYRPALRGNQRAAAENGQDGHGAGNGAPAVPLSQPARPDVRASPCCRPV